MWYSVGDPVYSWNSQPKRPPQNSFAWAVSPAGISKWTIWPAMGLLSSLRGASLHPVVSTTNRRVPGRQLIADHRRGARWSQPGSNRRPPRCQRGALPAELWPQERPQSTGAATATLASVRRLRRRISRFVRALFGGGGGSGGRDELDGGVGVREPRRPLAPTLSGAATLDLPVDDADSG